MQLRAPEQFRVALDTSKGSIVIEVRRAWAPKGADRFYNLARHGFYDETRFFRVIENFMVQFGLSGDPKLNEVWKDAKIEDDPVATSNVRGTISFATSGENTRTTQLFINYRDNSRLDAMGFTPLGRVVQGMSAVDALYAGYGEGAPAGEGPSQRRIQAEGNPYLLRDFPKLDFIKHAEVVRDDREKLRTEGSTR